MTSRSFGQIVREARLERHLSMGQLAAAVDRSTASVRRWERDDGLPAPEVIDTLVERLDLDAAEVAAAVAAVRAEEGPVLGGVVEAGDPIDVVPPVDADAGPVEWEQPEIEPLPAAPALSPVTAVPTSWPTSSVPVAVIEQDQNLIQILRDPSRPWLGYIRAALTIAALGALAYLLVWAVPEFLDAFGEMWDSLWPASEGTQL
jgi:transcriptional regulator with XRE-family HTH domain